MKETGLEKNDKFTYWKGEEKKIVTESVYGVDPYQCNECNLYFTPPPNAERLACPVCNSTSVNYPDIWR